MAPWRKPRCGEHPFRVRYGFDNGYRHGDEHDRLGRGAECRRQGRNRQLPDLRSPRYAYGRIRRKTDVSESQKIPPAHCARAGFCLLQIKISACFIKNRRFLRNTGRIVRSVSGIMEQKDREEKRIGPPGKGPAALDGPRWGG